MRELAEKIVKIVNKETNDYDAIDEIMDLLKQNELNTSNVTRLENLEILLQNHLDN
jgi:hypothetical protein